ncbi:MAG: DUF3833 domain-containing protein [Alphaproteobacteria bacterium]|nr:DUF3833 domain-containing protein [Alphaproteobacteria bacterium]
MTRLGQVISSIFTVVLAAVALAGCAPNNVASLAGNTPALSLEEFFEGETVAYGIFEDRFGSLKRQFRVNISGTVEGDTLTLDEDFLYDDGEKATRVWTITNKGAGADGLMRYSGTAEDIDGEASGTVAGNALRWTYSIDLITDDGTINVTFDDWIYQQDEHVAINRAYVSKFGIEIGSVTLVFLRGKVAAAVGPLNLEQWS